LIELATKSRQKLIETLADIDDQIAEIYLNEENPTSQKLMVY